MPLIKIERKQKFNNLDEQTVMFIVVVKQDKYKKEI